jgi:hypothetical protein
VLVEWFAEEMDLTGEGQAHIHNYRMIYRRTIKEAKRR